MNHARPTDRTPTRLDLRLRKAVGLVAMLLPLVLYLGNLAHSNHHPQSPYSVSGYYYTHWRDLLVFALGAIAISLIVYIGHDSTDRWLTNISGLLIAGLVFCPTTPTRPPFYHGPTLPNNVQRLYGVLHMTFAVILFLTLALIALRFTKTGPDDPGARPADIRRLTRRLWYSPSPPGDNRTPAKRKRDVVYRLCARLILIAMALAGLSKLLPASDVGHAVFYLEAAAVITFGLSWFVKGQGILAD
jgi:hypothetical protein